MSQSLGLTSKVFTLLCLLAVLFLTACQSSDGTRQGPESTKVSTPGTPAIARTPDVQIFVDEAMLRKPHAILGGTLKNVGSEKLENLIVEFELIRRADGSAEKRDVSVEPSELAPGGVGKYSIKVLSNEWSGSRIVRLQSSSRTGEVAFKTFPGARRPPEKTTTDTRVVKDARPRTSSKGEEFINTPDSAVPVP